MMLIKDRLSTIIFFGGYVRGYHHRSDHVFIIFFKLILNNLSMLKSYWFYEHPLFIIIFLPYIILRNIL